MLTESEKKTIQECFHIPVDSSRPGTSWIVSLDSESMNPTRKELAQIKSYAEFVVQKIYNEHVARTILDLPLPACGGHNTLTLRKGNSLGKTNKGWAFRRLTWTTGPYYVPHLTEPNYHEHTLVEAFDRVESILPEVWAEWKNKHPGIFPPQPSRPEKKK